MPILIFCFTVKFDDRIPHTKSSDGKYFYTIEKLIVFL